MKIATVAWRNIRRNKRRSALSMTAIAIATMAIVLMFSLIAGIKQDMAVNIADFISGHVRIRNAGYTKLEYLNPMDLNVQNADEVVAALDKMKDVTAISPRIAFPAAIYREDLNQGAMGLGVDFSREVDFEHMNDLVAEGRLPNAGANEMVMGEAMADKLGVKLGDKVTFLTTTVTHAQNAFTLKLVGIMNFPFPAMNEAYFYMPLDKAQDYVRMGGGVLEILVQVDNPNESGKVTAEIGQMIKDSNWATLEATDWRQVSTWYGFLDIAQAIYNVMAAIFFILASTVIINTTMMVIYERMREIGTIGAMGMSDREIIRLFFVEAIYLGVIGAAIGMVVGIIFTFILSKTGIDLSAAMEGVSIEMSNVIYPQMSWYSTIFVFFYSVVVASITSYFPTRRAAKIEPVEALRHAY